MNFLSHLLVVYGKLILYYFMESSADKGTENLLRSVRTLNEIENNGAEIIQNLASQRETLVRINQSTEQVTANATTANRLLRKMESLNIRQRAIFAMIAVIFLIAIIIIIYYLSN